MQPVSYTNTHHNVTDLLNHGTAKLEYLGEWNINFLRNKKILNLWPREHILKNYRFVAEVTFKTEEAGN